MTFKMAFKSVSLILCLLILTTQGDQKPCIWNLHDLVPCPFNENECGCCPGTTEDPFEFPGAACESKAGQVVDFKESPSGKYRITDILYIEGNVSNLPANYLSAFAQIEKLQLYQNVLIPRQSWDDAVFDGPTIRKLELDQVSGVIPVPKAMAQLGQKGLKELVITNIFEQNINLDDYTFKDFTALEALSLGIMASRMTDLAFAGLEKTLKNMTLKKFALTTSTAGIPINPLYQLKNLTSLEFESVTLETLPENAFLEFPKLEVLDFHWVDMTGSLAAGALDQLPQKLKDLGLRNVQLKETPRRALKKNKQLEVLNFAENYDLKVVKAEDFQGVPNLRSLSLGTDQLTSIEMGAFKELSKLESVTFSGMGLGFVDLSMFAGIAKNATISFSALNVTVSDLDAFPKQARIQLSPGSFDVIDPVVGRLLDKYPNVKIVIQTDGYACDDKCEWMAYYAICTGAISMDPHAICMQGWMHGYFNDWVQVVAPNCTSTVG